MRRPAAHRCRATWFAGLVACCAPTMAPAAPDGALPEPQANQDARLAARISLPPGVYYLPEAVERLSRTSGVDLSVRTPRGFGDDRLVVRFRDVRLLDALNAIWSVVSYRGAEWRWQERDEAGHRAYRLEPPAAPDRLANELNRWMDGTFGAELDALLQALHMSPEERAAFVERTLGPLLPGETDMIRGMPGDATLWTGLSVYEQVLPAEERDALVSRGKVVWIPFDQLPAAAKQFGRKLWQGWTGWRTGPDGVRYPVDGPGDLRIECRRGGGHVPPTLWLGYRHTGSTSYAGGSPLQRVFAQMLRARWLLPTEAAESALGETKMEKPAAAGAAPAPDPRAGFVGVLRRFAEQAPVSLVTRLPSPEDRYPATPEEAAHQRLRPGTRPPSGTAARSVQGHLDQLGRAHMMHKWRGPILLVSTMDWMLPEEQRARAPWSAVRALRAKAVANGGYLPFRDAVAAVAQAAPEQMPALIERIPELSALAPWQGPLRTLAAAPAALDRLTSRRGLPLDAAVRQAIEPLRVPEHLLPDAVAVYLHAATKPVPGMQGRRVTLGVVLRSGVLQPVRDMARLPLH